MAIGRDVIKCNALNKELQILSSIYCNPTTVDLNIASLLGYV